VSGPVPDTPEQLPVWRRALGSVAVDFGLLRRRRDFRLLTAGQAVSGFGSEMTFVAVPFQMYAITGSSLAVGLLGLAEFTPVIALALLGGALADAFDRRRLIQLSEIGSALVAGALVANALLDHPHVWVLYVCAALIAGFTALRRPPLDALVPRLVERDEFKAASALEFITTNTAHIAGPAIGGIVIATAGLATTYAVDVATFAGSLVVLSAMRTAPPPPDAQPPSLRTIADGLRYAVSRQELIGTYLVDMNAMFFGMPMALFPAIAKSYGGAEVVGLLFAAPAVGSMAMALTSGWTRHVHRHGRAVVLAAGAWGIAIVAFGFADVLWLALACLAVAGAMDAISGIFRTTIWNETIPDPMRGRLAGIEMISWSSGPLLGNVESGAVAALAGLRASVASGGLACVAGTVALALALPRFWRYDARAGAEGSRACVPNITERTDKDSPASES
jgi:MFS family permease